MTNASEAQNIAVVRRGYEAFAKGDIETLKTLFSPNAHWRQPEVGVLKGNYKGVPAILQFFGQLAQETQGSQHVEVHAIAASGDHVFVWERFTGKRKGQTLDTTEVVIFKLEKGIVTEAINFQSDYPTVAKFWS
ncbi:MAG: nuclear transport factor 2 family protein [Hyphomicrobiales bacterium]|nr:nuclear transport factor 2 family protein [Hyphomicrobiales bacterium]